MKGFKEFILRGNVVDLAVAVVIGAAFGGVVSSFVKDLLTPLIAAIGGRPDFSKLAFTLNGSVFRYGDFVNSIIAFVLIAAAVYYFVIVPMGRLKKMGKTPAEAAPPATRKCPECLSDIPAQARRCSHCGQALASISEARNKGVAEI